MAIRPIQDGEFATFQRLVEEHAGIHLSETKRALVVSRLFKRLRKLHLTTFTDYIDRVTADDAELVEMIDAICTNESHFFREPRQFDLLRESVIPNWRRESDLRMRDKKIRIWSAGCSTGEEPYSLAMLLLGELPAADGWDVRIQATDLSTRVLAYAGRGVWPIEKAAEIPQPYLKRFMLRGTRSHQGDVTAGAEVRSIVEFARLNLTETPYGVGQFDAVFCRNVLIYFRPERRAAVIAELVNHIKPGGTLLLGHAETLPVTPALTRVVPNVYVKS